MSHDLTTQPRTRFIRLRKHYCLYVCIASLCRKNSTSKSPKLCNHEYKYKKKLLVAVLNELWIGEIDTIVSKQFITI